MMSIQITMILLYITVFDLSWGIFDVGGLPNFAYVGYGDWSPPDVGAHPGVDFKDLYPFPHTSVVCSPTRNFTYVLYEGCQPGPEGSGHTYILGETSNASEGWLITHLDVVGTPFHYLVGDIVNPKDVIGYVWDGAESNPFWFNHVHLMWVEKDEFGSFVSHGLVNPLDYFTGTPGYDHLIFTQIPEYFESSISQSRGIIFDLQDGYSCLDENGNIDQWHERGRLQYDQFQDCVYGKVDFIVAPASLDTAVPLSDSLAGVRRLEVEVLKQSGQEWVASNYSKRTFFDFSYPIPYGDTDSFVDTGNGTPSSRYEALFFDPPIRGESGWYFYNVYIPSNSGCNNGEFVTSYDNIWASTNPYLIHDWASGELNRGCWDTQMRDPSQHQLGYPDQAFIPEHAAFPDGRYAVEVTATTHAGDVGSTILPKARVGYPLSQTIGVLVDNFYPHVTSLSVENDGTTIFSGIYSASNIARPHQDERTFTSSYFPREGSHHLELNISFSEPVILDRVWIKAASGNIVFWNSEMILTCTEDANGQDSYTLISKEEAPERYLGRLILEVDAHDLSPWQFELDSDPITIPFPHNGGFNNDECYEPGRTIFEWNVAYDPVGNYNGSCIDGWQYKQVGAPKFYECIIAPTFGDPTAEDNVSTVGCTAGPPSTPYMHDGQCAYWAGFWLKPLSIDPDWYDRVHFTSVPS